MSCNFDKWLENVRESYKQARRIIEDAKDDPPSDPYKSKYKAMEIFKNLDSDINSLKPENAEHVIRLQLLSAVINYECGIIALETEELSSGADYLKRSWEIIKDDCLKPEYVFLAINVLNHLGILWSSRSEPQKACEYLKQAELIYGEYKMYKDKKCPPNLEDLFSINWEDPERNDWTEFEKALTHTLYYLAQVYEHLGENERSAKYCHITLKRQLDSGDFDPVDWCVNCATMSQYFIAKEKFSIARHFLACSSFMIAEHESKIQKELENAEEEKWEQFNRAKADVARCWSKYCVFLLLISHDQTVKGLREGVDKIEIEKSLEVEVFDKVHRLMKNANVTEIEEKVSDHLISNYEEARQVFLFAQDCLNQSKAFYALNERTYDYVQILQDSSKLYKFLAFFELEPDRKCKMHKRRVDMLEDILKKLNPQFYLALCRQLIYELAEIYSEMMDMKLHAISTDKSPVSLHAVKKLNMLINKSIHYYEEYIDSLRDQKKNLPESFSDDDVRPALVAYFCLGRLYPKIKCSEPAKELDMLSKSEACYKFVMDYIEKNPQHEKFIRLELEVMRDMVALIPAKMQAIIGPPVS